jgi:oxygen-independent coproporphyrinogen III oxidase
MLNSLQHQIKSDFWPGYVYTYPHKKTYRPLYVKNWNEVWPDNTAAANLYVHLPFCRRRCSFCNLYTIQVGNSDTAELLDAYVQRICASVEFYSNLVTPKCVLRSIYFGGGTPNLLTLKQLDKLVTCLNYSFPARDSDIDPCIECAPEMLSRDYINGLVRLGFRRISIGVQSLSDNHLHAMRRYQKDINIETLVGMAQLAGLTVNLDLIYGLPGQSDEDFIGELKTVINMLPDNVAVYPLAIRERTNFSALDQNHSQKYSLWEKAERTLYSAGYEEDTHIYYIRIGGKGYQQQILESQGIPTIGIGLGARSYAAKIHYQTGHQYHTYRNTVNSDLNEFVQREIPDLTFSGFILCEDEARRRAAVLGLIRGQLHDKLFHKCFGAHLLQAFPEELRSLEVAELAHWTTEETFALTRLGRKYADLAAGLFTSQNGRYLISNFQRQ